MIWQLYQSYPLLAVIVAAAVPIFASGHTPASGVRGIGVQEVLGDEAATLPKYHALVQHQSQHDKHTACGPSLLQAAGVRRF